MAEGKNVVSSQFSAPFSYWTSHSIKLALCKNKRGNRLLTPPTYILISCKPMAFLIHSLRSNTKLEEAGTKDLSPSYHSHEFSNLEQAGARDSAILETLMMPMLLD